MLNTIMAKLGSAVTYLSAPKRRKLLAIVIAAGLGTIGTSVSSDGVFNVLSIVLDAVAG
jgi:hypothetical protein